MEAIVGFTERLNKQVPAGSKVPCTVTTWRNTQTASDQNEFDQALKSTETPTVAIFRVMQSMGYSYGASAVRRHRAGECRCDIR